MVRRRTDKAVEQLRNVANEVREEIAFTCSDFRVLPIPAGIIRVLKDAAIARRALDASEMRLRRRAPGMGSFPTWAQIDG